MSHRTMYEPKQSQAKQRHEIIRSYADALFTFLPNANRTSLYFAQETTQPDMN
jgi:hypothetical protein